MPVTTTRNGDILVLVLGTLGRATEVEMILSLLQRPRWPRQVEKWLSLVAVADVIAYVNYPIECSSVSYKVALCKVGHLANVAYNDSPLYLPWLLFF